MKLIVKSFLLFLGLMPFGFIFAGQPQCPTVTTIKTNANFIQAIDTKLVGWAFYSDSFGYNSNRWNLFYRVLRLQARTKSEAIAEAKLKLEKAVLTSDPNIESGNGYTRCVYAGDETDRYVLFVITPPYYGGVP